MAEHPEFNNPPIKEAIIDLQVASPSVTAEKINCKDEMRERGYTESKSIFSREIVFNATDGKVAGEDGFNQAHVGFRYENPDNGFVVQMRTTGFTLSKLAPYCGWDQFITEAQNTWGVFRRAIGDDFSFERVAARYINSIQLPVNEADAVETQKYLINDPQTPDGLPESFCGFFSRVDVNISDINGVAMVTQADGGGIKDGFLTVILDIDVFTDRVKEFSEQEAWDVVGKIRHVKNQAFIGSLTDDAKELFG